MTPFKAKHRTYCAVCAAIVARGQPIAILPTRRWGHQQCAEQAWSVRASRPLHYDYRGRA